MLARTVVWVASIVAITMVLSLGLAQLFNQRFPGRRVARWALIAPWAASVMMTALVFRWSWTAGQRRDQRVPARHRAGAFNSNESTGWAARTSRFVWMMASRCSSRLPFTTYALLAGLQAIPGELFEAARVDGASPGATIVTSRCRCCARPSSSRCSST